MEAIDIKATRDQIEELKGSLAWADITKELESWSHGFNMEMQAIVDDAATQNPSTAAVLLHMGDLNGRQKAVDYILALPDVFLQILEDRSKNKQT